MGDDTNSPEQWSAYISTLGQAMQASSGFARTQLDAQIKDAQKARQNAMAIAKLQADVQKYGINTTRQNLLDQLKENARQFDQNHELEMQQFGLSREQFAESQRQFNVTSGNQAQQFGQTLGENQRQFNITSGNQASQFGQTLTEQQRQFNENLATNRGQFGQTFGEGQRQFNVTSGETAREFNANNQLARQNLGLSYAKTATDYLSTPDTYFQARDFINMGQRAVDPGAGGIQPASGMGPTPYGAGGAPTPKTTDDFAVLAGYTQPGERVYAGGTPGFSEQGGGAPAGVNDQAPDPRLKAAKGIFEALPPSQDAGLDDSDWAALQAAKALYSSNLRPGTLQRMRPGQQAMLASAGRRLGYDPQDFQTDYTRYQPGQQGVRVA
jgi:hypothetical protein